MEPRWNYHFFALKVNGIPEIGIGRTVSAGRDGKAREFAFLSRFYP